MGTQRVRGLLRGVGDVAASKTRINHSLARASSNLMEMEVNVYADDVRAALSSHAYKIEINLPDMEVNEIVEMEVRFDRDALNCTPARNEFVCVWSFEPSSEHASVKQRRRSRREAAVAWQPCDRGWVVTRAFPFAGDYKVSVNFMGPPVKDGTPPAAIAGREPETIPIREHKSYTGAQWKLELVRLFALVFVLLIPLIGGAQEKLASMDPLAGAMMVVALGFAADTVLKKLTETPAEATTQG